MKKFLLSALTALMLVALPNIASATNRITVYLSQNPDTNETNLQWRYQRLADGTMLRDIMGPQAVSGAWSNLIVVTTGSLNVKVDIATPAPSTSPQAGMLYQLGPNDPNAVPQTCPAGYGCNQIVADPTQIVIPALITANSSTISVPAPGSNSVYYLIEGQINTVAANSQSLLFISSSGAAANVNVNTEVDDTVSYQSKEGAVAASPTPPAADTGWVPIATVLVPTGATNCNSSCTVAMLSNYNFTGNNFNTVHFGGPFAQDGNINPSILTTEGGVTGCGLSAMGGFVIKNQSALANLATPYLIAGDLSGNINVCGQTLTIQNNGGGATGPAQIVVNTTLDSGSPGQDTLTPGQGQNHTYRTSASCSSGSWCGATSGEFICQGVGANIPSAAFVVLQSTYAQQLIPTVSIVSAGGLQINLYNTGSTIGAGTAITYNYVCL